MDNFTTLTGMKSSRKNSLFALGLRHFVFITYLTVLHFVIVKLVPILSKTYHFIGRIYYCIKNHLHPYYWLPNVAPPNIGPPNFPPFRSVFFRFYWRFIYPFYRLLIFPFRKSYWFTKFQVEKRVLKKA